MIVSRVYPHSLSLQSFKTHLEAVTLDRGHLELATVLIAVVLPAVKSVGQVKAFDPALGVIESQGEGSNGLGFTKGESSEAHFLDGAGRGWVEEVDLVYVDLIVDSIDKVGVDGFLQVGK